MKFKITLLTLSLLLLLTSCVKVDEETITGDVKNTQDEIVEVDEAQNLVQKDEALEPPEEITQARPEEKIATEMGAILATDKGAFYDRANSFLYAVMDKDYATLSSFTGGKAETYNFLDGVDIVDFELYPLQFADGMLSSLENDGIYPTFEVAYLANLLVKSSDAQGFVADDNYYFLAFTEDSPMGNEICAFVPYDKALLYAFTDTNIDSTESFIREFVSLYGDMLSEGRNYPDSFDFSHSSHLITHLMAENGYGFPPYSLDTINSFLSEAFDSAKSLDYIDLLSEEWLYPVYSDISDGENIYGCSYAHGGYSVEHTIISSEIDGNDATYEIEVFADYAHFARAYKVRMNFTLSQGKAPMLTMVSLYDVTGAESCAVSL